ncbi:MAG: arsenic efflux protein [Clostridia bacterium]|nr:arsenic efflux protein [Clostridia bacterium]
MFFEELLHLILHALKDSALVFPFLILTYIVIEVIQRKANLVKNGNFLSGKLAPLYGSALGIFPQCGFSVMASKLYENNLIKAGTLLSVFIATSDEAFSLLLTSGKFLALIMLLLLKFLLAVIVGFLLNAFIKKSLSIKYKGINSIKHEDYCRQCGQANQNATKLQAYLLYPLWHAVKTFLFVLIVNFAFGTLIHFVGENSIVNLMQTHLFLQPIITSLVGLIPNCASSILITQLYIKGGIAFGSMFAGLCANAGIGIAIILKTRKNLKNNLLLILLLYIVSVISGIIINLFI